MVGAGGGSFHWLPPPNRKRKLMPETQSGAFTRDEFFRGLFQSAQQLVTPLANRLMDENDATRNALNESIEYNRLNGSGPVDPALAERSPQTYREFLFGNPAGGLSPLAQGGGMNMLIMGGLILALGYFIFRR